MNRADARRAATDGAMRMRPDVEVTEIIDVWRIDDAWCRDEIARHYFPVLLDDRTEASIYHDLVSGQWFEQRHWRARPVARRAVTMPAVCGARPRVRAVAAATRVRSSSGHSVARRA